MFSKVLSAAVYGVQSRLVQVEADTMEGLPSFSMVGYLSTQVREAQDRVRTALKNSGIYLQPKKITVNLSPADLHKSGTGFDLPIAVAIGSILWNGEKRKTGKYHHCGRTQSERQIECCIRDSPYSGGCQKISL